MAFLTELTTEEGSDDAAPRAERMLRLLGLGYRARQVVVGVDRCGSSCRRGRCAAWWSRRTRVHRAREKVVRLAAAKGVPLLVGPAAAAIGARLGLPR